MRDTDGVNLSGPHTPLNADQHAAAGALDRQASYDALGDAEQATLRQGWDERIIALRSSLNLEAEFRAAGESWVEAEQDGTVVHRP